ncbi:MAG TPA: EAL domain-containing response regulator [Terracidiphilus sp.]|jgi:EAL domain-containing protein (putative c-di-GMP-specific phosphodiesterase class I)/CheY-like chemotaxis protein|nr:EAL domain-containing response regulator [Terracidiphilus sp.]
MPNAEKILVIDDDAVVCDVVAGLAQALGLECATTKDPSTFPDLLTRDTSLIVLDLMMPEMDGIEVLRQLGERRSTARILLMSGMDNRILETAERLAQSLGLWVVGRLQKPIPLPALKEALETLAVTSAPESSLESPAYSFRDEELREALDRKLFQNFYQPQIDLRTGQIIGLEALVRWNHPRDGVILPEHFIPRMNALGLMDELCWSSIHLALADAGTILEAFRGTLRLSLNAAIRTLENLTFPDALLKMAHEHGLSADQIVIEVTESGLALEPSRALDVLTRLRMKGFQLSIDDFGAGYATMRQVQNVPATELKIDRGIVEKMHVNLSDRVMVEKIVEMGHELGMTVIAEGVATRQQLELLRHCGCDQVQGFLFSRPLPANELVEWLRAHNPQSILDPA